MATSIACHPTLLGSDETRYPARDARIDDELGAKRIEWHRGQKMKGNPWNPVTNVETPAITCTRPLYTGEILNRKKADAVQLHRSLPPLHGRAQTLRFRGLA
jgi:hypothetical protein